MNSATTTRVGSPGQLDDRPVVCFLDRDHVLDVALALISSPPEVSADAVERFLWPEIGDVPAVVDGSAIPHCVVAEPPANYGSVATPPAETSVLVVRRSPVSAEMMKSLPRLRHIQKLGDRTDTIDVEYAAAHGISVDCVSRPSLESTADHAIMLMLATLRRLFESDLHARTVTDPTSESAVSAYNWAGMELDTLSGKTLGIIGMGEVGILVARRAHAFGVRILYCSHDPVSPQVEEELGLQRVDLDDLLAVSDIVSVHVPGTASNSRLVDEAFLHRMKAGAILINVARGDLVDEAALVSALREQRLAGAGLDVHAHEPRHPGDPLLTMDRVILTPHIAGGLRGRALPEILAIVRGIRKGLELDDTEVAQQ
ncbi:2-hydroxyacid dehydrogenase [Rhodococcus erythropolis]|uniref:2-hydroxyacid dehydrogenase n=1 Tax=Rhodococcus erythropolis TaxID=1833 RepID=UPI00301381F6